MTSYIKETLAKDIASGFLQLEGEIEMIQTAQKTADIRFRVELKNKPIVVYKVRSSDDSADYQVTLVNGRVSSCDCPAHGYGHNNCYIKRDVQAREDARKSERLSREAYVAEFGIYE